MIHIADYDIGAAFQAIEDELIRSMIRNMKNHRVEEVENKKQWEMWQAKQLESLERYKKKNRKKYNAQFADIDSAIDRIIQQSYVQGGMEQEIEILNQIKKRYGNNIPSRLRRIKDSIASKVPVLGTKADKDFFQVDDKKLDALIHATKADMAVGEHAMLRMADDQYRKIIFNAQVYAASGAGTYEKAVDMATKDFLAAGINCIEYKNGRRVNIKSYAEMSIRTAQKWAGLYADGQARKKLGISTVITKKRLNACPKCLPFVDKILIDDVWSGGKPEDGPYPLVGAAISAGFLHPNCKDHLSTYIEGITDPPDESFTQKEIDKVAETAKQEAEQQYAERQAEKYGRLAEFSLDDGNKKCYTERKSSWEEKSERRYSVQDSIRKHRADTPERMVDLLDKHASDEFVLIDETADDAFSYNFDKDAVVVNPKHSEYERYDKKRIMIHEIAHRIDRNEFSSPMNTDFSNALIVLADRIKKDKIRYQNIFAPGGDMEYNELISDIFGMLTDNEIAGFSVHDLSYVQHFGNREMEVFANMFTLLYTGENYEINFVKQELPELYESFIQMIGGI